MRGIGIGGIVVALLSCVSYGKEQQATIQAEAHARLKIAVVTIRETDALLSVAQRLKEVLGFSGQFQAEVGTQDGYPGAEVIKKLSAPLALFLAQDEGSNRVKWWLYDTHTAHMIAGKRLSSANAQASSKAHMIADAVWPLLTDTPGMFSSKIAYCKEVKKVSGSGKAIRCTDVCIADFDGANERVIKSVVGTATGLRWNRDARDPLLFYTDYTWRNARLMATNMLGKQQIVSDYDGLNTQPVVSPSGKKTVYCASRGRGSCQLYLCEGSMLKRVTHNQGNNSAPTFGADDSTLYFCSDYQMGNPQVYRLSGGNKTPECLMDKGYYGSLAYNARRDSLAFTKMVSGKMQLFTANSDGKNQKQHTFDTADKQGCSWSSCGNYVLTALEWGGKSKIAILSLLSGKMQSVTKGADCCRSPAWSGLLDVAML